MEVNIQEADFCLSELNEAKDIPIISYERGKNIVKIKRALKQVEDVYNEEKKVFIEQYAKKDEKGEWLMIDSGEKDKNDKPIMVHDFGADKEKATKLLTDLYTHTYVKDEKGDPIKIEIDFHKVSDEKILKMRELDKEGKNPYKGLAYTIEFLEL